MQLILLINIFLLNNNNNKNIIHIVLTNFFNREENPIFKSFDSAKGKGLAGFITSLNFSWIEDNILWEVNGENNRAPKLCKIRVSFSPIHDIAPGIDSNGYNRAPIYPVGDLSTATSFELDSLTEFE